MELILPSLSLSRKHSGVKLSEKQVSSEKNLASDDNSYHAFRIGDIGFLIPHNVISEVADELPICRLPNTTAVLSGMANLRGNIIPVFDLHELFGFEVNEDANRKVLIIGRGENSIAVLTSELPVRITVNNNSRLNSLPPIPDVLRSYTKSCYQDNGIWLNVDHEFYTSLSEYLQ